MSSTTYAFVFQVEVQKLLKQNEYFERSNNEMEAELKESIQDADTSERDARFVLSSRSDCVDVSSTAVSVILITPDT